MKYLILIGTMLCACSSVSPDPQSGSLTNQGPSDNGAWVNAAQDNADPCADYTRTITDPDGGSFTFTVYTFCEETWNPNTGDPAPFINKGDPNKVEKTNAISR